MIYRKIYFVFWAVFIASLTSPLCAQNKELGYQFFSEQKYAEAIDELEKVYKNNTEQRVYETLLQSYIFLNKYNEGLKLVDKQLKNQPQNTALQVDKIHLLESLLEKMLSKGKVLNNYRTTTILGITVIIVLIIV